MLRYLLLFLSLTVLPLPAEDETGPAILITSPDTGTTFATGSIQHRSLVWNDKTQTLSAEVTFVDDHQTTNQPQEDTHRFRLPGITFDKGRGTFYATTSKGEIIPVAQRKKILFLTSIEVLPNAIVRIYHHHGNVSVALEAIRPADLARIKKEQSAATPDNPDSTHTINLQDLLP